MSSSRASGWRRLTPDIKTDELQQWLPGVRQPVAITGATGFVGSHVAEALAVNGVAMRLLVRDRSRLLASLQAGPEMIPGSIEDPAAVERLVDGCGTVLHLAGRLRAARPEDFDRTNRVGTELLVAAAARRAAEARLVHVSSLAAAGPSGDPAGSYPDAPAAPISAYGRSKLAGEAAARGHSGAWAILRPPAVYGPRDIDVLQFFRLAARGVVPLPAGESWATVAHVSDVVRAILAAASGRGNGRVLNVGEPEPYEMRRIIRELAAAGDVHARIVTLPAILVRVAGRLGDVGQRLGFRNVALTSDKARELLARHWSAHTEASLRELALDGFVPFRDGARSTWAWYRDRGLLPRAKMRRV